MTNENQPQEPKEPRKRYRRKKPVQKTNEEIIKNVKKIWKRNTPKKYPKGPKRASRYPKGFIGPQQKPTHKITEKLALKALKKIEQYKNKEIKLNRYTLSVYVSLVHVYCKHSLYFFARHILGFDLLTPETHKRWAKDFQENLKTKDNFLILKPRGCFKTTLYGEAYTLWLWAVYSPEIRIFYTSCNMTLISEVTSHLDTFLDPVNESMYYYIFGVGRDMALTNTTEIFNILGKDKNKKGHSLTLRPAGGKTAGIHPDIIIVDDPLDNEDRESPAIRLKKERWFDTLSPLLSFFTLPDGSKLSKTVVIGTRWHLADLFNYIIELDKQIKTEADRFYISTESIYTPEGLPSYPEFFDEIEIEKKRSKTTSIFFACQYLNNPLPDGLQIFKKDRLHFISRDLVHISDGVNYTFFDWSKGLKTSDFPATIFVNRQADKIIIFDAIEIKHPLDDLLKIIANRNKAIGARYMFFEVTGSTLIQETLERVHREIDHPIIINPVKHNTNKMLRIEAMEPELYSGKVLFLSEYLDIYPELMNQLLYFPVWANDDFPDVIEMAVSEIVRKGLDISPVDLYNFQKAL